MKFSGSIEYAIHALIYLARRPAGHPVLLADIATALKVPDSYLRKVFQTLARGRIVATHRGARGGVTLSRSPDEITLRDVVEAVDGSLPFYSCLRDQRGCVVTDTCPVKSAFEVARRKMAEALEQTTVAGLAASLSRRAATWLAIGESA